MKIAKIAVLLLTVYVSFEGIRALVALHSIQKFEHAVLDSSFHGFQKLSDDEEFKAYLTTIEKAELKQLLLDQFSQNSKIYEGQIELQASIKNLYRRMVIITGALAILVFVAASLNKPLLRAQIDYKQE